MIICQSSFAKRFFCLVAIADGIMEKLPPRPSAETPAAVATNSLRLRFFMIMSSQGPK